MSLEIVYSDVEFNEEKKRDKRWYEYQVLNCINRSKVLRRYYKPLCWLFMLYSNYLFSMFYLYSGYILIDYKVMHNSAMNQINRILSLLYFGLLIYFLSRYKEKPSVDQIWYLFISMSSNLLFALLGNLNFLKISITDKSMDTWSIETWEFLIPVTILVVILSFYHIYIVYKKYKWIGLERYIMCLFIIPLMYVGLFYQFLNDGKHGFHLHHWFLFGYLAIFSDLHTPISRVCNAICIGIFVNGISAYNAASIYY